ncbi:MAG: four helix bundle protein [Verrucomicrobiales bacterium]|nr:four helix bundle protein [Verrucomicrobiales bacterium]
MENDPNEFEENRSFDLESRTEQFARAVRTWIKSLPRTISNAEDIKQLVRASGSVAANYIEANEALSKKDFLMRIKICRKEAKESGLFLRLIDCGGLAESELERTRLDDEANQLMKIFGAILRRSSPNL